MMLRPNPWNPEAVGSQAGPPRQGSGGDPDRSRSHTGGPSPGELEDGLLRALPHRCASGLRV